MTALIETEIDIRPYQPGDERSILATFNLVFRETNGAGYVDREMDVWNWQFRDNPEGHRISLAVTDAGTVAAQYAGVPLRVKTPAGDRTFVHIVDSFVHPEFRKGLKAPGLFVRTALPWFADCYRRGDAVPYGFPVPRAERIGQRYLYYHRLRVVDYLTRDLDQPFGVRASAIQVERMSHLGPEVDALFERFAAQRGCLTRRSASYLSWRYVLSPGAPYQILGARRGGELLGLMVLRPELELIPGSLGIVDWIVPDARDGSRDVTRVLLERSVELARARGRSRLLAAFASSAPECAHFLDHGFVVTPSSETMERRLTYQIYDHALTQEWLRDHWWYTLGDSDLA